MKTLLYQSGRLLQAVGMAVVLVGIFLSVEEGVKETGTSGFHSMAIEFRYLGIGGAVFIVGFLISRFSAK
ncbi:MAG: hypothetical protein HY286_06320 [Planctomycetes bacterium]|nr:hypothetical protein [Planctomycetota bacterium]